MAAVLIPLAFYLDVSQVERILMISAVVLVMVVELINTAIEAVVDRIGSEHHELAGMAKDAGSAAVFVCLGLAGYVWLDILCL
jgi:diacylglycerol kinase (ATP)